MINIVRSRHGYGDYKSEEIREIIKQDFGRICYLCEGEPVQNYEIDHFYPLKYFEHLENVVDNLFYICSKCNKIRPKDINTESKEVLNPCIDDVENLLELSMDLSCNDKQILINSKNNSYIKVTNTVILLNKIYNGIGTNSPSYKDLRDDIFNCLVMLKEDIVDYQENKIGTLLEDNWQRKFCNDIMKKPSKYFSFKKSLVQEMNELLNLRL